MPSRAAPRTTGRPAAASASRAARAPRRVEIGVEGRTHQRQPAVLLGGPFASDDRHGPPGREPTRRGPEVLVGPIPVGAVVVAEQRQADHGRFPLLQQIAHEDQVAEGLGHLPATQPDQAHVQPVTHEAFAGHRLGLRRLALVMGEHQVTTTTVDVDRLPQLAQGQGRALDVPSGPTRPPTRLPGRLVGERGLPQDEIQGMALVGVVGPPALLGRHGQHGRLVEMADRAEPGEPGHVEIDGPGGLVGVAGVEHRPDQGQDLGDRRRGAGLRPRRDEAEGGHVGVEPGDLLGRQVEVVHPELRAPCSGCRRRRR